MHDGHVHADDTVATEHVPMRNAVTWRSHRQKPSLKAHTCNQRTKSKTPTTPIKGRLPRPLAGRYIPDQPRGRATMPMHQRNGRPPQTRATRPGSSWSSGRGQNGRARKQRRATAADRLDGYAWMGPRGRRAEERGGTWGGRSVAAFTFSMLADCSPKPTQRRCRKRIQTMKRCRTYSPLPWPSDGRRALLVPCIVRY